MRDCEVHATVTMHNITGRELPLTWLLLGRQFTVDLIANSKMLVEIRKVPGENAIRVRCNSGVKIVNRVGNLAGYRTF